MAGPLLIGQRELTEVDLSRIAREIARDIQPLDLLLQRAGLDNEAFERIKTNPIFQTRLVEEAQIWSASTKANLRERVSVKAASMIEELLLDTVGIIRDPDIPGAARVQALQFLAKLGHLGEGPITNDDGSGRVQINILIGGQKLSFDKESSEPKTIDGEVLTPEVSDRD
jgi:hypothetical protein